ncbi:hypothetical protein HMPREF3230_01327 [Gardnerella vaginalis]|uniref:Peptidase n=1 Tax=Gardnerella vaginalis TaxID=2702 RepID=A0A135Z1U0_GARVA|nr:hypothetical protein [Gardnerella vaginalis]KXI15593.1 hypothetical protein HMPREF3230_01327 [Gardnerella vaginalis]
MLNKKAIAAFAAGATLLAGFAMSTPAFAADAKADKCASLQQAVDAARTEKTTAELKKSLKEIELKEKTALYNKAAAAVASYKTALKNYNTAKEAYTKATGDKKDEAKPAFNKSVDALNKVLKSITDAAYAGFNVPADASKDATVAFAGTEDQFKDALEALKPGDDFLKAENEAVQKAEDALTLAENHLAKAGCTVKPGKQNPQKPNKPNKPNKPGKPGKHNVQINTKGRKGKKQLSKTGVGVAFAALAAALLAGMGAAVRKIRH